MQPSHVSQPEIQWASRAHAVLQCTNQRSRIHRLHLRSPRSATSEGLGQPGPQRRCGGPRACRPGPGRGPTVTSGSMPGSHSVPHCPSDSRIRLGWARAPGLTVRSNRPGLPQRPRSGSTTTPAVTWRPPSRITAQLMREYTLCVNTLYTVQALRGSATTPGPPGLATSNPIVH